MIGVRAVPQADKSVKDLDYNITQPIAHHYLKALKICRISVLPRA